MARGIDLESDENYANATTADTLTFEASGGGTQATVAGTVMASEGSKLDIDRFALGRLSPGNSIELQVRLPSTSTLVPYLRVVDLALVVEAARRCGALTVVDSTFATPINLRPLDLGIDLVVHSATKYLAGHNDLMAGVVIGSDTVAGGVD